MQEEVRDACDHARLEIPRREMGALRRCGSFCPSCRCLGALLAAVASVLVAHAWRMWPHFCCDVLSLAPARGDPSLPPLCPEVGRDVGKDLARHGYSIVPGVLGADGRRRLLEHAAQLPWGPYFSGYRFPLLEDVLRLAPVLWPALEDVIRRVQDGSVVRVADAAGNTSGSFKAVEFLTADGDDPAHSVDHVWHQDFEAFYLSQQTYQYLNMYLVLEKPQPLEAGLSVVSMEALRARAPALHDVVLDQAASVWTTDKVGPQQQLFRSHKVYDRFWIQDFQLDDLSCTPPLVPGDLLVLRGDTPHRTQYPVRSRRTTLSIRLSRSNFSAEEMLTGGLIKYARLQANAGHFMGVVLKAEFGEEDFRRMAADVRGAPAAFRWRLAWLRRRILLGHRYRLLLSWFRCGTGWLLGEPFCAMAYY